MKVGPDRIEIDLLTRQGYTLGLSIILSKESHLLLSQFSMLIYLLPYWGQMQPPVVASQAPSSWHFVRQV